MKISMMCPICCAKFEICDLPELELEDMDEGGGMTTNEFYCTECGKRFYIGG